MEGHGIKVEICGGGEQRGKSVEEGLIDGIYMIDKIRNEKVNKVDADVPIGVMTALLQHGPPDEGCLGSSRPYLFVCFLLRFFKGCLASSSGFKIKDGCVVKCIDLINYNDIIFYGDDLTRCHREQVRADR